MTNDVTIDELYDHLNQLIKIWVYDKAEIDEKIIEVDVPTNTSDLVNDGEDGTHSFITAEDIAGKADSSDLATVATSGLYTDLDNIPETFAPTPHEHGAGDVKDSNAHSHLGTVANATQSTINQAINDVIGSLLSVDLVVLVDELPQPSRNTMNKLYMKPETDEETDDKYEVYITVETEEQGQEPTYDWEKIDSARIDISGKADVNHTHGNISADGKIGSNANQFVYTTTGGTVTSKATIGNIDTNGAIGNSSGKLLITGTNGIIATSDSITELDSVIQELIEYGEDLEENNNGG